MDGELPQRHVYRFDRFVLDIDKGALCILGGADVPLRAKTFELMQLFAENPGRLLSREAIMGLVWPDVFVTDDSITQCVGELRRALGDDKQRLLRTVRRRGYVFAAEVARAPAARIASGEELIVSNVVGEAPGSQRAPSLAGSERRRLTVLCCSIIESRRGLDVRDPEDPDAILTPEMELCGEVIEASGGYIANYIGRGLVAYFGYPYAREHAAERSIRAGLALVEAVKKHAEEAGKVLTVRVGIATGVAVNSVGHGAQRPLATGQAPNVAAGLQRVGAGDEVLIDDTTRRMVGQLFALQDLGACALESLDRSVQAWRISGEGVAESRFEALRGSMPSSLFGRERELSLLLDCWKQAKEGEGQVVLLTGEPGIGKSRLVRALRDGVAGDRHSYLGYYCSSFHRDSPFRPVIAQLERSAEITSSDSPVQKLAKTKATLAGSLGDDRRSIAHIATLLSIPRAPDESLGAPSPKELREGILGALLIQLENLAAHGAVLLVWEDVQWADPSSLELLALAVARLRDLSVMAVVTYRPDFSLPWPAHAHVTSLGLSRLGRAPCQALIVELGGGMAWPVDVRDRLVRQADGVPLFVEELTRAVLASGRLRREGDRLSPDGPLLSREVPDTLQDSLMSRLDRLGNAKELAQIGAVIGKEFSAALLALVASRNETDVDHALWRLMESNVIFRRGVGPKAVHVFQHALIRDVAYDSLLKRNRRSIHGQVARVLEQRFPQVVEADPHVLAYHWAEAGERERAAGYHLRAGEKALARSATSEAVAQLTLARDIVLGLAEDPARGGTELDIQIALGAALSALKGLAAPEVERAYARARELCARFPEKGHLSSVLLGLWASYNARDELERGRAVAVELLDQARRAKNPAAEVLGRRALGATLFGLGQFSEARVQLEELVRHQDLNADHRAAFLPYNPYASGRAWLALSLAVLGFPEQALAQSEVALSDARALQHHNTLCLALSLRCSTSQMLRDEQDVAGHADTLVGIAKEQGFAYWTGLGVFFQGWAQAWAGDFSAGIVRMEDGLAFCAKTGMRAYVPYNLAMLGEVCHRAGELTRARTLLDTALEHLKQTDARYCEAELLRIDGEQRRETESPDRHGAEASFQRAIAISRTQEAKLAELRATTGLAKLWAGQDRRRQARDVLAPIQEWFTEGLGIPIIKESKDFLDTLV